MSQSRESCSTSSMHDDKNSLQTKICIERPIYYCDDYLLDTKTNHLKSLNHTIDDEEQGEVKKNNNNTKLSKFINKSSSRYKQKCISSIQNSWDNFDIVKTIYYFFPILSWLPKTLNTKEIFGECIAGMTVLSMQIPQGLAFARLAGVEPVHGLLVSLFTPVVYALCGTSRHVSIGTYAVVSIVCRDVLERLQHLHDFVDTDKDPVDGPVNVVVFGNSTTPSSEDIYSPIEILVSLSLFVGVIMVKSSNFILFLIVFIILISLFSFL